MTEAWWGPRALARAAGVSTDTLRHYERVGLLARVARTPAGYRRYPPETLDRVRLIQRALTIGFTLRELAGVLARREKGDAPCRHVRTLVADRLAGLETRVVDLQRLRDEMRTLLADWDQRLASTPAGQRARLLDVLAVTPMPQPSPRTRTR